MRVLALNGSPTVNGNTEFLLNEVLNTCKQKGAEVEIIKISDALKPLKQPFCVSCSSPCNGSCYKDTPVEQAFLKMEKADAIIIGSPVYFGTVSAQLKAFWDKSRPLRTKKALVGKVGGAVTCGFARFGGQETTIKAIHDMMLVQGMTIIADGASEFDAGHHGVCAQAPANQDEFAIKRAKILAERIISH